MEVDKSEKKGKGAKWLVSWIETCFQRRSQSASRRTEDNFGWLKKCVTLIIQFPLMRVDFCKEAKV